MDDLSEAELFAGFDEAGLARCAECGSFYKLTDCGCDLCSEGEMEKIAA